MSPIARSKISFLSATPGDNLCVIGETCLGIVPRNSENRTKATYVRSVSFKTSAMRLLLRLPAKPNTSEGGFEEAPHNWSSLYGLSRLLAWSLQDGLLRRYAVTDQSVPNIGSCHET